MKMIEQNSVDIAFNQKAAREITIVMLSEREWYFTFVADDPVTGKPNKYTLLTQRGKLRTWADPKYLFKFLHERGVIYGNFKLNQDERT
ncbi:KorA protein [Bartonella sp. 220]|nr:KorA protein [Bartonella sp. 220B]